MSVEASGVVALLWVYDMPRSIHFYRDMLGAEVTNTSEVAGEDQFDWAMLRLGYARFMLNTIYDSDEKRPTLAPSPEAQSQRDVWMYFDCRDVDGVYAELQGRNVDVSAPVVTNWGTKQVFVADPDGYRVCFQCPAES